MFCGACSIRYGLVKWTRSSEASKICTSVTCCSIRRGHLAAAGRVCGDGATAKRIRWRFRSLFRPQSARQKSTNTSISGVIGRQKGPSSHRASAGPGCDRSSLDPGREGNWSSLSPEPWARRPLLLPPDTDTAHVSAVGRHVSCVIQSAAHLTSVPSPGRQTPARLLTERSETPIQVLLAVFQRLGSLIALRFATMPPRSSWDLGSHYYVTFFYF